MKADGAGLEIDLLTAVVSDPATPARVLDWAGCESPRLVDVPVPGPGGQSLHAAYVAAVCVLDPIVRTDPAKGLHHDR